MLLSFRKSAAITHFLAASVVWTYIRRAASRFSEADTVLTDCPVVIRPKEAVRTFPTGGDKIMMFRKTLLTAAAAFAIFALSSVARADTITLTSLIIPSPTGLTAQVSNYSLVGNTFTFTITNTSVAPGPVSVLTNIGFNLPMNRQTPYVLVSSTNANYYLAQNLPTALPGINFDFVLMNRPPTPPDPILFAVGDIANGIQSGQSATFSVSGDFSGLADDLIARLIFARFENGTPTGSDIVTSPTPEPMTVLLFGTGLAGVAARIRRRRRARN